MPRFRFGRIKGQHALDLDDFTQRKTSIEEHVLAVEYEQVELRSQVVQRDLAIHQVSGAAAVVDRCGRG